MVALSQQLEVSGKEPQRFFPRHHTHRLRAARCSKSGGQSRLRERIYDGGGQLESCSKDPIGYLAGSFSIYSYVGNEPTNYRDPFGLERQKDLWPEKLSPGVGGFQFASLLNFDCDSLTVDRVWLEGWTVFTVGVYTYDLSVSDPQITKLSRKGYCRRGTWYVTWSGEIEVLFTWKQYVGIGKWISLNWVDSKLTTYPFRANKLRCGACTCDQKKYTIRDPLIEEFDPEKDPPEKMESN